jgi:hypothetical protein
MRLSRRWNVICFLVNKNDSDQFGDKLSEKRRGNV